MELAIQPPVPVGLVARAGDGAVDLEWQAPPAAADRGFGYNVYRGRQAGVYDEQPINAQTPQRDALSGRCGRKRGYLPLRGAQRGGPSARIGGRVSTRLRLWSPRWISWPPPRPAT